jgi:RimJ/RimL family protein N-acetyltransferase
VAAIREALPVFGRRIAGFDTHDAVMTGVETRTSSPIRIARGADMQSLNTPGLFPAGEGAGYAGGILSAGVDGIRAAEAVAAAIAGGTVVRRRGTKVGWSGFILTGKSSASDGPLQPVVCRAFVSASNRRLMKADSSQAENALTTVAALRTARLILRQWHASDFAPFAALNDDPAVMEFMPKRLSHAESDMVAARLRDHIEAEGRGLWAVEVPGVAPFIGYTGLSAPGFKAHFTPCVEVGWRLARAYWGQGYATEAASAAIAHGFGALGLREIVSFTVPANVRSRAVMERLRMRHNPADDFDHPALPGGHKLRRHMLYRLPI